MNLTYTHDGAGNVKTISGVSRTPLSPGITDYTHTANKLDGSTGKVVKTYTHDDAGNIISDGGRTFVYNQNNRLVQVKNGETVIAEYAYDGFGRRVKKTVGSEIPHYHYDLSGQLICETDESGNAVRDYVYLNGEPVAMQLYGDDAGWYYFVNDHLGTPQKVVDGAGAVVWEAGYLPFGEARLLVADIENNLRFPGQYYDGETGLHYNWHRYYDPETGRYWSADPIGFEGGINLYAYAGGNSVNLSDPKGISSFNDFLNDFDDILNDPEAIENGFIYGQPVTEYDTWYNWSKWKVAAPIFEASKAGYLVFYCKCVRTRRGFKKYTTTNTKTPILEHEYDLILGGFSGNSTQAYWWCEESCDELNCH